MYPATSNWQSGEPYAAWFARNVGGGVVNVCATQGRGFVKELQRSLNGQRRLRYDAIAVDGIWGPATMQALQIQANALRNAQTGQGWQTFEDAIYRDSQGRTISRSTLQFAVWLTYYRDPGQAIESVSIPQDALLPRYGSAPDDDRGYNRGALTCWNPDREPGPAVTTRNDVDVSQGQRPSTDTTPPGYVAPGTTSAAGSGSGTGLMLGLGLVALAAMGGGKSRRRAGARRASARRRRH